jgi:hypothetical protein
MPLCSITVVETSNYNIEYSLFKLFTKVYETIYDVKRIRLPKIWGL